MQWSKQESRQLASGGRYMRHDIRLFVGDVVEEARVLMGKAVVVLLPDVGGQNHG